MVDAAVNTVYAPARMAVCQEIYLACAAPVTLHVPAGGDTSSVGYKVGQLVTVIATLAVPATTTARAASTAARATEAATATSRATATTRATATAPAFAGSIRRVNPLGGRTNCVNCTVATDATLTGSPASALLSAPKPITVLERVYGGTFKSISGQAAIETILRDAGSGARA